MADPKPEAENGTQKEEEAEAEEEEDYNSSDYTDYTDSSDEEEEAMGDVEKEEKEREEPGKIEEEEPKLDDDQVDEEELWNFPPDNEHWTEEDLGEHWEDYWGDTRAVGWDPNFVSDKSREKYEKLWNEGKPCPPGTPYYVPYRKHYPPVPDNHFDIQTPEDVVEELERTEEFLRWYSYLFKNGSSYEGTVWDDLAHGKGVYTTALDICRYEGEWFQNMMQGHGVLEVDLPVDEPVPDSKEAIKAKEEGQILRSDYMDPFDREWLKMDIEEQFAEHGRVMPSWEEKQGWIDEFGELPEKGHYKYAGQWKHNRFHGCGVYEVNARPLWGKFYFGELLPDPEECNEELSALHASMGEIAAAKARMFANKPDGMVRQVRGPFTDPSHPYMYEEEDLWMAPGFLNAYYEVPEDWRVYVEDLDSEREMWLNSFMKAPFVIPMPPELEYMWQQEDEFVLLGNQPSAMLDLNPENVARASKDLQGEVLLHVPSGRIINWITDAEGKLRFFFQPITENGEVIPEAIIPLRQGFDEYMKDEKDDTEDAGKKNFFQRLKEAWAESSEEAREKRERKKEELDIKFKQDVQALEFRQKLRRAERNLALQIKIEKLRAERKSKSASKEDAVDQTQSEESSQDQQEEDDVAKSPAVDDDDSKEVKTSTEDKENTTQEDQEDQEDNDDDKKPRSFGKVALVGIEDDPSELKNIKHSTKQRGTFFPTAFASLTLGPSVTVGEAFKSKVGRLVADLWHHSHQFRCLHDVGSLETQLVSTSQKQTTTLCVKPSRISSESLGLHVSSVCQRPYKMVCSRKYNKQIQLCVLEKPRSAGVAAHYPNERVRRSRHQSGVDVGRTKPVSEFLSLALPLEQ